MAPKKKEKKNSAIDPKILLEEQLKKLLIFVSSIHSNLGSKVSPGVTKEFSKLLKPLDQAIDKVLFCLIQNHLYPPLLAQLTKIFVGLKKGLYTREEARSLFKKISKRKFGNFFTVEELDALFTPFPKNLRSSSERHSYKGSREFAKVRLGKIWKASRTTIHNKYWKNYADKKANLTSLKDLPETQTSNEIALKYTFRQRTLEYVLERVLSLPKNMVTEIMECFKNQFFKELKNKDIEPLDIPKIKCSD